MQIVQLADWLDFRNRSYPQISPDGRNILYARTRGLPSKSANIVDSVD